MKRLLIIVLMMTMILIGCSEGQTEMTDYSQLFELDVHEINITLDSKDYEEMLASPMDETYYSADIEIDGISLENVAFRTKGNSTLKSVANSDSDRYSYKINVSKYEDQELLGLDEFVLNNMFSDPSYMREYISYTAMAENGGLVPMTTYINVSINGELQGLYLMVETVDDSFLERQFGDNDGNLYRCDSGTTLAVVDGQYIESIEQKNGDDESLSDLYHFMDVLNEMPQGEKGAIESVLDVESALNYFAANTVMESYDSYNGQFAQNFYLYNDHGIFTVIPWDYNMSLGTFGQGDMTEVSIDQPVLGTSLNDRPLIDKLLAVDAYKAIYYDYIEEYVDYFESIEGQVNELKALIDEDVNNDPTKFSTYEQFQDTTTYQENGETAVNMMNGPMGDLPQGQEGFDPNQMDGNRPPNANGDMGDFDPEAMGERPNMNDMPNRDDMPNMDESPDMDQMPEEDDMPMRDDMNRPGFNNQGKDDQMMAGNSVSIINIMLARIENLKEQLSN